MQAHLASHPPTCVKKNVNMYASASDIKTTAKTRRSQRFIPESLGRTSTLHASLVVSEIVEP